jgi:ABC-type dipeptide/oligopeptide/nickel transport system ATPase component
VEVQREALLKKIDLHIHTVATFSDAPFTFSLESFKSYVEQARLDAIAVTNHDVFDGDQFRQIKHALNIPVFPGIEVNLENGHVLVICDGSDVNDFQERCNLISKKILAVGDSVTFEEFQAIYGDLNRYLIIPHSDKDPSITGALLQKITPFVTAGEVDSPKKFIRAVKDEDKFTPVLFSDTRVREDRNKFPSRQTFIDCGEVTFDAIKACLADRTKVALSEKDGNSLWPVFLDGQKISTGLNILLGERSSGKTYTLDRIRDTVEHPKYISQFSLVQHDDAAYEKEFNSDLQKKRSIFVDEYLAGFKGVLDEVINIDLHSNERQLERYLESLLQSAAEADRQDAFSKVKLYKETEFSVNEPNTLHDLIESVRKIIENIEFRGIIQKHIDIEDLKGLIRELIENIRAKALENKKKKIINELIKDVKQQLALRTSAVQVDDVNLYDYKIAQRKVEKFSEIVGFIKAASIISEENIQGFKVEAKKGPYTGAGEVKIAAGNKLAYGDAFKKYDQPYVYLRELLKIDGIVRSEIYKLFCKINYQILNSDGFPVSGGERSEFRLLQSIMDAKDYDILLIDEPESSFDNLFLKSDVNKILKHISQFMPVVIVTHNSTVGASIGADYILYAKKEVENGGIKYRIYSGYPSDKAIYSTDGKTISNHEVVMNSLEAGSDAYRGRQKQYETIEN